LKKNKKQQKTTWAKPGEPANLIERKMKKEKHENQFSINQMLNNKIEKKINFKK
jgi:hypothetical protein